MNWAEKDLLFCLFVDFTFNKKIKNRRRIRIRRVRRWRRSVLNLIITVSSVKPNFTWIGKSKHFDHSTRVSLFFEAAFGKSQREIKLEKHPRSREFNFASFLISRKKVFFRFKKLWNSEKIASFLFLAELDLFSVAKLIAVCVELDKVALNGGAAVSWASLSFEKLLQFRVEFSTRVFRTRIYLPRRDQPP